jgi:hypothetical protein
MKPYLNLIIASMQGADVKPHLETVVEVADGEMASMAGGVGTLAMSLIWVPLAS